MRSRRRNCWGPSSDGQLRQTIGRKTPSDISLKIGDGPHTDTRRLIRLRITGRTKAFVKADLDTCNRLPFFVPLRPDVFSLLQDLDRFVLIARRILLDRCGSAAAETAWLGQL